MTSHGFRTCCFLFLSCGLAISALADGPRDNDSEQVRRIPKLGIELSDRDRSELRKQLANLRSLLDGLQDRPSTSISELLPDVEIFYRAVHDAVEYQELFSEADLESARELLRQGQDRARALSSGDAAWSRETGLVVRGYRSRIDHSVQPYGLVVPPGYSPRGTAPVRLDVWFHGRGETLSELRFIQERGSRVGRIAPRNTIVLHPYGRYCNAFKFAGEVDVLEAIADVRRRYRIDENRISVRGFSMGGAAAWQFAVHYADRWFASNPGAGFSETPQFLRVFQQEDLAPSEYEQKLWQMYDCTGYAANLRHCPTVAYSGELDRQKQAADVMADALLEEGISLTHIIGPGTKHNIHPDSKVEIERRMSSLASRGRRQMPPSVNLVLYTLKYNRMHWVTVNGLREHWVRSRIEASLRAPDRIVVSVENVTDFSLDFPAGWFPSQLPGVPNVEVIEAGTTAPFKLAAAALPLIASDRSWTCRVRKDGKGWSVSEDEAVGLRKRHNLQGPIDDAFMDSFIFVRPTQAEGGTAVDRWVESELEHAIVHWRRQFRGQARVKLDHEMDERDIESANLVLFGNPQSNAVLQRIAGELPIEWSPERIRAGTQTFDSLNHALVAIYPNPLNPDRYVVLNSGFTFREYDYLNNARQVPKLPDWAVIDIRTPVTSRAPGKIAAADFFDERWRLR